MTKMMSRRQIWFVCDHDFSPCVYAADAVLALRADPPRCLAHSALLLSSTHHDDWPREQVLDDVTPDALLTFGQFEIGAQLRDRRRRRPRS